jgi:peptidoglycan hydrolase-like protein with peptidoglycan-binding domain
MRSGSAHRGDRSTMGHGQYDSSTVRNVQQALQNKGYDVGTIDGVMGPRTKSALREFQQQQGLNRSGQLDQPTLSALDVQASAAGARSGTMDSAAPNGDRTGAGSSGTSAAGGSPSPSAGSSSGTTGAGGTMSDRSTPPTGDRSGTGSSGTSAAGGSPSPAPSGSAPGGRPGG